MEQVPEVHISEAQVACNQPDCDGMCVYINNKSKLREFLGNNTNVETTILMEDDTNG